MKNFFGSRLFLGIVVACVSVAAVVGLWISGSPAEERARRLDGQRLSELQQISNALDQYWNTRRQLPPSLDELRTTRDLFVPSVTDPLTGEPYGYRIVEGDRYELCAIFALPNRDESGKPVPVRGPYYYGPDGAGFWQHDAGRSCFLIDVRKPVVTPLEATKP